MTLLQAAGESKIGSALAHIFDAATMERRSAPHSLILTDCPCGSLTGSCFPKVRQLSMVANLTDSSG
jgi:hypothetical protein